MKIFTWELIASEKSILRFMKIDECSIKASRKTFPKIRDSKRNLIFYKCSLNFENQLVSDVSKDKRTLFEIGGNSEEAILYFISWLYYIYVDYETFALFYSEMWDIKFQYYGWTLNFNKNISFIYHYKYEMIRYLVFIVTYFDKCIQRLMH